MFPCNPCFHPIFFLRTSTGRTPEPIVMVDGSNDASRHKKVPFGYAKDEKMHLGGLRPPKPSLFFDPVGKSQPKLWWSITFKRYDLATYLQCITCRKSWLLFLNLQRYQAHSAPWRRYLNQFTDVRCFKLLFSVKLGPKRTEMSIKTASRHAHAS